jgi:hypothetical protein
MGYLRQIMIDESLRDRLKKFRNDARVISEEFRAQQIENCRVLAVGWFDRMRESEAVVIECLKNENPSLRKAAVEAYRLFWQKSDRTVAYEQIRIAAVDDSDPSVQSSAALVLADSRAARQDIELHKLLAMRAVSHEYPPDSRYIAYNVLCRLLGQAPRIPRSDTNGGLDCSGAIDMDFLMHFLDRLTK